MKKIFFAVILCTAISTPMSFMPMCDDDNQSLLSFSSKSRCTTPLSKSNETFAITENEKANIQEVPRLFPSPSLLSILSALSDKSSCCTTHDDNTPQSTSPINNKPTPNTIKLASILPLLSSIPAVIIDNQKIISNKRSHYKTRKRTREYYKYQSDDSLERMKQNLNKLNPNEITHDNCRVWFEQYRKDKPQEDLYEHMRRHVAENI